MKILKLFLISILLLSGCSQKLQTEIDTKFIDTFPFASSLYDDTITWLKSNSQYRLLDQEKENETKLLFKENRDWEIVVNHDDFYYGEGCSVHWLHKKAKDKESVNEIYASVNEQLKKVYGNPEEVVQSSMAISKYHINGLQIEVQAYYFEDESSIGIEMYRPR